MQRLLLALFLILGVHTGNSQNIFLGEKMLELKPLKWLGNNAPTSGRRTHIEFFDTRNDACHRSLEQLCKKTTPKSQTQLVIVARISESEASRLFEKYLSPTFMVALDPQGRIFSTYDVKYVPFEIITDERQRAVWFGNPLKSDQKIIEENR